MAVRPVLKMGHPLLRQIAQPVDSFDTAQMETLLTDMEDTMRALNGAGIAAPQIGVSLRVVIFEMQENPRYPHVAPIPFTVLINPQLEPLGLEPLGAEKEEGWEGCLSVPGLRGVVPRYRHVHYSGLDRNGAYFERTVEGFHARVVQHEIDHLDGVLFPQRVEDMTRFGFEDALLGQMVPTPD